MYYPGGGFIVVLTYSNHLETVFRDDVITVESGVFPEFIATEDDDVLITE